MAKVYRLTVNLEIDRDVIQLPVGVTLAEHLKEEIEENLSRVDGLEVLALKLQILSR
jgi:hypothetical protein